MAAFNHNAQQAVKRAGFVNDIGNTLPHPAINSQSSAICERAAW
jgi:hypothetical protein